MESKDIDLFYNTYKNSISTIRKLDIRLLKESYSYTKWSASLREKSETIRVLYQENERMLKAWILPFIKEYQDKPRMIEPEIAEKLLTHIDFFSFEGFRDYQVVVPLLELLIPYYESNGPTKRLLDAYFFMGLAIMEQQRFMDAIRYFDLVIGLYPEVPEELEDYRRFRIMSACYYRLLAAVCEESTSQKQLCEYQDRALHIWTDEVLVDFITPKKKAAIRSIINALPGVALNRLLESGRPVMKELIEPIREEFQHQKSIYGDVCKVDSRIYVLYYKYQLVTGKLSESEYRSLIREKWEQEYENNHTSFDYGEMDFTALFDDELPDEDFAMEYLFYMNPSFTYIYYLVPEVLGHGEQAADDTYDRKRVFSEIRRYYAGLPVLSGDYFIDYKIERQLKTLFAYCESTDEALELLDCIYINRQVMTVLHSAMVGRLASVMTEAFIKKRPELFVGQAGCRNVQDVREHQDELLDYVWKAGRCHDIGKIVCTDVINLQGRPITDEEFGLICAHPEKGAEIVDHIEVLKPFRDVVLGHHKFFDGSKGYPRQYDNTKSEKKIFLDIIKICDCIDAATDRLGRNYAKAKDFGVVLEELKAGSGEVYSGELVELIDENKRLIRRIEELTREEREIVYYEIYRKYVEPAVRFRPRDEKQVRLCRESNLDKLAAINQSSAVRQHEMFVQCQGRVYIVVDGYNEVYGYVFVEAHHSKAANTVEILELVVQRKKRRRGYGSMLLQEVESRAKKEGYTRLLMPLAKEGHFDKFGWRNGFVDSEFAGFMEKKL